MKKKTKIFLPIVIIAVAAIVWAVFYFTKKGDSQDYEKERQLMVQSQIIARGISDKEVIRAMENVPRHQFVDKDQQDSAYQDRPLPIGEGQTISQPYIVALMTEELDVRQGQNILEIGTGSGYQAAVLAQLTENVYTVEIITSLYEKARDRLANFYPQVIISNHDGYYGWEKYAPYDRIIVTAAPDHIPQPLVNQLAEGGIMIIPVGPVGWNQVLWKVTKQDGQIRSEKICDVVFVPLVGGD